MISGWTKVLATHEEAQPVSAGKWVGQTNDRDPFPFAFNNFPGIALPSTQALGRWTVLRRGCYFTLAQVVDVGPFCVDDHLYVFGGDRPRAERFKDKHCPYSLSDAIHQATVPDGKGGNIEIDVSNGAGIDLFPRVAKALHIPLNMNVEVEWKFYELIN